MPKVAIIYLIWNDEPRKYLERALLGIIAQTYPKIDMELVVIYNSHKPEESSQIDFIREQVQKMSATLPRTTILEQEKNLGFTGGNNLGMKWAAENGCDYVFLHNADGYLEAPAIEKMTEAMEDDRNVGEAQALLLLHPEKDLINSAGNGWQYLGIGFCSLYRKKIAEHPLPRVKNIGYVSGAAAMMRVDLLKKFGYLNEDFYLYHEDTEYSLRLKLRGYKTVLVSEAIFYHEYVFKKNPDKFFWLERNRHALKYLIYKRPTRLALLPLEIIYNLGLMFVSWRGGWFKEFKKVHAYWLKKENRELWRVHKKSYDDERLLTDSQILAFTEKIVETGELIANKYLAGAANLVFTLYYFLLKMIVRW